MREDAVDIYNGTTYKMPERSPARLPTSIGRRMKMRAKMPSKSRGRLVKYLAIPEPESPQEVPHVSSRIPGEPTRKSLHVCSMMGERPLEAQWPYQLPEYRA
ncbi:predicted protein [Coccidioides posadasii str. Silveira]|uniref:Predicted protein n=2 Tax=Coccidioides posadasii TaxID=199306 RepID=E9CZD4_COCPS|nr:predicted protein [Coccidioides posadasii str. Silveira]KMM72858.1 hypothetical protein CPAG_09149 [Coccidioides posadasii RMSCC 3488]